MATCHLCREPVADDDAVTTDDPEGAGRLEWCPDLGPCLSRALDRIYARPVRTTPVLGGREREPVPSA